MTIRVITLNLWGGKKWDELAEFLKQVGEHGDIFCFQEVFNWEGMPFVSRGVQTNLLRKVRATLPENFYAYFAAAQEWFDVTGPVDFPLATGNAIFVRAPTQSPTPNDIELISFDSDFVYGEFNSLPRGTPFTGEQDKNVPRRVAYATIKKGEQLYRIYNFHGLWNGRGKSDTAERIAQSTKLKALMQSNKLKFNGRVRDVLCGDFNLLPETESYKILAKDMNDVLQPLGYPSTRSSFYTKAEKRADYILTDPGINVLDIQILPNEVSDHLALQIDFI